MNGSTEFRDPDSYREHLAVVAETFRAHGDYPGLRLHIGRAVQGWFSMLTGGEFVPAVSVFGLRFLDDSRVFDFLSITVESRTDERDNALTVSMDGNVVKHCVRSERHLLAPIDTLFGAFVVAYLNLKQRSQ